MSAARAQLRSTGFTQAEIDLSVTAGSALQSLDDVIRIDPDTIAAQWYSNATPRQIRLFHIEWKRVQKYWKTIDESYVSIKRVDFENLSKQIESMQAQLRRIDQQDCNPKAQA
jgi:hypothetical protein